MKIQKKKPVELEIIDLAFGGKGIAKPDGYPIFVDRTVPGDTIIARITKKKKSYAEAQLLSIEKPSHLRQEPPCKYADHCGGCRWQTLGYETQLEYKQRHVVESLEHIGLLKGVEVLPVIPSKKIFEFRNKMEFSCTTSRWLMPEELENTDIKKGFGLGLHVPGTFDRILDIERCLIQPDLGNEIMEHVRRYILESGVPAYGLRSHEGFWRFLMLRSSSAFNTWMVNIVTKEENDALLLPLAQNLKEAFPSIVSIVNNVTAKKAGIAMGDYEKLLLGEQFIREKLGRFTFEISANSFFQTNTLGAEQLYSLVSEYADLKGDETVVDLYSGTGTIPIWLSDRAKKVVGIEIIESAVMDARKNAAMNKIENCEFFVGDIKDVLPRFDTAWNVMIIDPPRAGMHKDVVAQVMAIAPRKIVYVSCNPATLARDLSMLKESYRVVKVQPVDMFPHTFHIESVALLEALQP